MSVRHASVYPFAVCATSLEDRMITARRMSCSAATALLLAVACTKNPSNTTTPTTPSCTVTAGTISASTFPASGGTGSVPVTAGSGCTWTATSSATFVTISAGASGTGNGTVNFTVAANTGAGRTATLSVAGTSFTITQSGVTITPGTLSPPTARSPIGGTAVDSARPTLTVANAVASGTVGTVTYRFEISDLSAFPDDPVRTFSADGIAQGPDTTSAVINRDLGPDVLWYWHARATDGTVTSAYSATETFRTPTSRCTFTVSPTTVSLGSAAATATIIVTAASTCGWTAVSGTPFISVTAGASGTGNGTVTISVDANTGATRTGTVTVAGQTVTVTQTGGSSAIVAAFQLLDPASQAGPTDTCRFRSATDQPTTCVLQSTSFPVGATGLVAFSWTVQYTYVTTKTLTQSGSSPQFSFTDMCGQMSSTADGVAQPLSVTLTVTDSAGNTATATSGTGNQPPLFVRLFTCGS
jgi:hypothetical protein